MKKSLALILALVLVTSLFAGCQPKTVTTDVGTMTRDEIKAFEEAEKISIFKDERVHRKTALDMMRATFRMFKLTDLQTTVSYNMNYIVNGTPKLCSMIDLIQAYYDWYKQGYRIDLRKVKGHAGNEWNELADQLATGYISEEEAYATYS